MLLRWILCRSEKGETIKLEGKELLQSKEKKKDVELCYYIIYACVSHKVKERSTTAMDMC
jgi:hypothetical protein